MSSESPENLSARIAGLKQQLDDVYKYRDDLIKERQMLEERGQLLAKHLEDSRTENQQLKAKLEEQVKVTAGLEVYLRFKREAIEVLPLGTEVIIDGSETTGKILRIEVTSGGIWYKVSYQSSVNGWLQGRFPATMLEPLDPDILPQPKMYYKDI